MKENREEADAVLAQLERVSERWHVRQWFGDDDGPEARDAYSDLHEARADLKSAVREKRGGSAESIARVAEILRRAAKEISDK